MATNLFTFDVADAATATRIRTALCADYLDTIPDPANPGQRIPNPQTKAQYAKQKVRDMILGVVISYERDQAAAAAPAAPAVT